MHSPYLRHKKYYINYQAIILYSLRKTEKDQVKWLVEIRIQRPPTVNLRVFFEQSSSARSLPYQMETDHESFSPLK